MRSEPFADFGADFGAGDGAGASDGDLLGVFEDPEVDPAGIVLGTTPEVEAVGDEGVVLGYDDDEEEEGRAALAEVLAFGTLISGEGTAGVAVGGLAIVAFVCKG